MCDSDKLNDLSGYHCRWISSDKCDTWTKHLHCVISADVTSLSKTSWAMSTWVRLCIYGLKRTDTSTIHTVTEWVSSWNSEFEDWVNVSDVTHLPDKYKRQVVIKHKHGQFLCVLLWLQLTVVCNVQLQPAQISQGAVYCCLSQGWLK